VYIGKACVCLFEYTTKAERLLGEGSETLA